MIVYNMRERGALEYDKFIFNTFQLSNMINYYRSKMNTSKLSSLIDEFNSTYNNIIDKSEQTYLKYIASESNR